jgi:hypothetical protein
MKADELQTLYHMKLNEYFFFRGQRSLAGLARFHTYKKEKEGKRKKNRVRFLMAQR